MRFGKILKFPTWHSAGSNSAFLLAYALMYLGGGRLVDAVGTRRGFFWVMVLLVDRLRLHGLANGLIFLGVCRFLLGLGEGGGIPAATKAVAEWFPMRERSAAIGLFNAGTAVGAVAAAPVVAAIIAISNWRWAFFVAGAIGLFGRCGGCGNITRPRRIRGYSDAEREEIKEVFEQPATPQIETRWIDLLALPQVWGLGAGQVPERRRLVLSTRNGCRSICTTCTTSSRRMWAITDGFRMPLPASAVYSGAVFARGCCAADIR